MDAHLTDGRVVPVRRIRRIERATSSLALPESVPATCISTSGIHVLKSALDATLPR